jgi:sulfoxide reductase catalytic subunit YedY
MVHKPKVFDLDEVLRLGPLEERVYRMRCVEGWSMVIPWAGLPLSRLLDRVEPMGSVRYVAFQTLLDPTRLPGQRGTVLNWPYVEGLRMDEAMHPLTCLRPAFTAGTPPRTDTCVWWCHRYGFKGIKSIVKITLLWTSPDNLKRRAVRIWILLERQLAVPHPRWSQRSSSGSGKLGRRPTLLFKLPAGNHLPGMDLRVNY